MSSRTISRSDVLGLARLARQRLDEHRHHDLGPSLADQRQRAVEVEQDMADLGARLERTGQLDAHERRSPAHGFLIAHRARHEINHSPGVREHRAARWSPSASTTRHAIFRSLPTGDGVNPHGAPSDQDHLGVSDVERLPARHPHAKGAERLRCHVFEDFSRSHHRTNLRLTG